MRIEICDISKHFGSLKANDGIDLAIGEGEIHGVLGENGAGKSTLMKILSGFIQRTSGSILLDGHPVAFASPSEAVRAGIGMLYQDPMDFQQLSVLGNFMLGRTGAIRLDLKGHASQLQSLCRAFNFHLRPDAPVQSLTVGERQQLELLRLLALGVGVLVLDEPTTGISTEQKGLLFESLKRLSAAGKSVVLVSHKLEDVEALCDRVTVLRQGRKVGQAERPFERAYLLDMMFGSVPAGLRPAGRQHGAAVLRFDGVSCTGGRSGLSRCSVAIHEGEVVGLAGLEGSGQELFLKLSAGLKRPDSGRVIFDGNDMSGRAHRDFAEKKVAYLPAARLEEALIPGLTIAEHAALRQDDNSLALNQRAADGAARDGIERFRIKGRPETLVEALSGGNQQRLLLSQLIDSPRLLLLENPSRGLDVESAIWVWQHLMSYARGGAAVVFSSAELDEIVSVSDRVLVFFNGRMVADMSSAAIDPNLLGNAIAGAV
jgi:simple sugar transport system ATP-binding protein